MYGGMGNPNPGLVRERSYGDEPKLNKKNQNLISAWCLLRVSDALLYGDGWNLERVRTRIEETCSQTRDLPRYVALDRLQNIWGVPRTLRSRIDGRIFSVSFRGNAAGPHGSGIPIFATGPA